MSSHIVARESRQSPTGWVFATGQAQIIPTDKGSVFAFSNSFFEADARRFPDGDAAAEVARELNQAGPGIPEFPWESARPVEAA